MSDDEDTMMAKEVAVIYERFPWLEKVCARAGVDEAYVKDIGMGATVRDAFAYVVQANGDFTEIEQKIVRKPLWPGTVFIDTYKEVDMASAVQQADSATYVVLIQNRCITVFELKNV